MRASLSDIAGQAAGWLGGVLNSLLAHGAALISLMSLLVVTPVVAFYMLLDYHRMIAAVDGLIPPRYRGIVHQLAHQMTGRCLASCAANRWFVSFSGSGMASAVAGRLQFRPADRHHGRVS